MTTPEDQKIIDAALKAQKRRAAITVVTPTSGVLPVMNLKNLDNWRAFFHNLVGVLVPILVTANIIDGDQATAWIPFVFAIADNVLSVGNTSDRIRRAIYAGVGVLQAGGLVTTLLTSVAPEYVPIGSAVLAVASAFLARFYTPTTTMVPAVRVGPNVNDVAA